MSKKWARLTRELVGYSLVGRDARATVTSSTGETVTSGPIQGVRIEEKPDRYKLPDFKTFEQPTYIKVEVQINGEWFLVSKVEVKRSDFAQGDDTQDREPLDALRKALAEDDGTRLPIDPGLMVRLANTGVPLGEVRRYFREAAAKTAPKRGGVL